MLDEIKTLLGIGDDLQDGVLNIIIKNVTAHLTGMLRKPIPPELDYIVVEIAIRRFNRLGTEGMKSESVEGHRIDFYDLKDEFIPYLEVIGAHKEPPDEPKRGRVMFI